MSDTEKNRTAVARFSLRGLLAITALVAVGIAVVLAYRTNRSLTERRNELLAMSPRLKINSKDDFVFVAMPEIAKGFRSWVVHVPQGQEYELQLGIGSLFEKEIPPLVGKVRIPGGQHRVTLLVRDSVSEEFQYVVYLDGDQVIEKKMGSDWMPDGWSSARSLALPSGQNQHPASLQLASQIYEPRLNFGSGNHFHEQSDGYVSRPGYRLWIARANLDWPPVSPFLGFSEDPRYLGIGLRNGIRFQMSSPNQLTFSNPNLARSIEPILQFESDFSAKDGADFSSRSQSFGSWKICNSASGTEDLLRNDDPSLTTQSAFLHGIAIDKNSLQPVLEMKWDASNPDQVGLRLAEVPANDPISRWRIRILGGSQHLWRELQIGDRQWMTPDDAIKAGDVSKSTDAGRRAINSQDASDSKSAPVTGRTAILHSGDNEGEDLRLQWQTNESLPLQIVGQTDNRYSGLELFRGIPLRLGIEVPAARKPNVCIEVADQNPVDFETTFPGGSVFHSIQIELEGAKRDWIWIDAKSKK